jgi:serine/threonine-protein kinase
MSTASQPDSSIDRVLVLQALDRIAASAAFQGTGRSGTLLRFLVERTLAGEGNQLKEFTLGVEALGRGDSFDPRTDAIVRVEVSRLRKRLDHYYANEGAADAVRVTIPRGSYAPLFEAASAASDPPAGDRPAIRAKSKSSSFGIWRLTAAVAFIALAFALWSSWRAAPAPGPVTRVDVDLGTGALMRSTQVGSSSIILSPDGSRLVFIAYRDQQPRLMMRRLDLVGGSENVELPGTTGARSPFFSPDGRYVGFLAGRRLWKVAVDGGDPTMIADALELLGASWGDDGSIVAALTATGLMRIPSTGGVPEPLGGTPIGARWPEILPGSRGVLFTAGTPAPGPLRVDALSLVDGTIRTVVEGASHARYLNTGHLLWVARQTLLVAPFDLDTLQVTGPAVPIIDDIASGMYGGAEFGVSSTGTLVFRRRPGGGASVVQWVDARGRVSPLLSRPAEYFLPRISPDGSRVAFSLGENPGPEDFRIVDTLSGEATTPLAAGLRGFPVWVPPDGRFLIGTGPSGEIRWMRTDGTNASGTLLARRDAVLLPWSISPDGRLAFYQRGTVPEGSVTFDIWTVPVTVGADSLVAHTPEPFIVSDAQEFFPAWSPDGRWMAYTSLEEDAYDIYIRAYPDRGRQWRVSNRGATVAVWSSDGRHLYYQTLDHRVMIVDVSVVGDELRVGTAREVRDIQLADTGVGPAFDVAPDGRLLGLMRPPDAPFPPAASTVTVVMNVLSAAQRATQR